MPAQPLPPALDTLASLCRPDPASRWRELRRDPGLVILAIDAIGDPSPGRLDDPRLPEAALGRLSEHAPAGETAALGEAIARRAESLARLAGNVDPDAAYVAGLLTTLGTLLNREPLPLGDALPLARRYARRHAWPESWAALAGHWTLPADAAARLGADPALVACAQLAAEPARDALGWLPAPPALVVARDTLGNVVAPSAGQATPWAWADPRSNPLLGDLLRLAASSRRLARGDERERAVDALHAALEERAAGEGERLRRAKLSALAEFAAGAAHEINNPLGVITGRVQALLNYEHEPEIVELLESVLRQTRRVHTILVEVMQFARPPRPVPGPLDLPALVQDAVHALRDIRDAKGVSVELSTVGSSVPVSGDARLVGTAVAALVRNALEAAPPGGWVRVTLEATDDGVSLHVEDSGPGVCDAHREHLFDPFFCGRPAGRGRGLGLPTAWRLAREHGGDVAHTGDAPTRFTLRLPADLGAPARRCA